STAAAKARMSRSRRLDGAEQLLELVGGVPDSMGGLVNDVEGALVLADLQELVDEILAGLQLAQEVGKFLARPLELADRAFGGALELAPALDQELPVLGLVARLRLERLELLLGAGQRLGAEAPDHAIVGDRTEQLADLGAQLLDLLARVLGAVEAVDVLGAVVEFLREIGERLLELVELAGELVVGGGGVGRGALRRSAPLGLGEHRARWRRDQQQKQRREHRQRSRGR